MSILLMNLKKQASNSAWKKFKKTPLVKLRNKGCIEQKEEYALIWM